MKKQSKQESHDIDIDASLLFESDLKPHWVPHDQGRHDFGIDYRVEWFGDRNPSGLAFLAQLKGKKNPKLIDKGKYVSFNLNIERIRQYCNSVAPVFLVIGDLQNNKCYYVFIQRYVNELLKGKPFSEVEEKSLAIRVPTSNVVADKDTLFEYLRKANRYLASESALDGLLYYKEELSKRDSRFTIDVSATPQGRHIRAEPKQPVEITYRIDRSKVGDEEYNNLLRGLPMSYPPGSIEVIGSNLFEYIVNSCGENGGKMVINLNKSCYASLYRLDKNGEIKACLEYMKGHFEGGRMEMRYSISSSFDLVRLHGVFYDPKVGRSTFTLTTHTGSWTGKPILNLPLFHEFSQTIMQFDEGDKHKLDVFFDGVSTPMSVYPHINSGAPSMQEVAALVDQLSGARKIAAKLKLNPVLPETFDHNDVCDNNNMLALLNGEIYKDDRDVSTLWFSVSREHAQLIRQDHPGNSYTINLISDDTVNFYGISIYIEGCHHIVTGMRLVTEIHDIERAIESGLEWIPLLYCPVPGADHTHTIVAGSVQLNKPEVV